MIYVSVDIETTGTDRQNDQILEFGAIIEDSKKQLSFEEIPKFEAIILHDRLSGNPYALNMNARLIEILAKIPPKSSKAYVDYVNKHNIINPGHLGYAFAKFLRHHLNMREIYEEEDIIPVTVIASGKNFDSFDKQFLLNLSNFSKFVQFNRRSINVAEFFIDFQKDMQPPSLDECLRRAGFKNDIVNHKALDDAWDVIKVLRTQYHRSFND